MKTVAGMIVVGQVIRHIGRRKTPYVWLIDYSRSYSAYCHTASSSKLGDLVVCRTARDNTHLDKMIKAGKTLRKAYRSRALQFPPESS